MRTQCILSLLVPLALSLPAQTMAGFYVTPVGTEFIEGNSSSAVTFGNYTNGTRTQQIDLGLVGEPIPVIRYIGWRQNNASSGPSKVVDVTVLMSHADYAAASNTFASNYKDAPVTVFAKKSVTLPDWSVLPSAPPAPFTLVLPFDVPFLYNRVDALLWEVVVEKGAGTTYSKDWVSSMTHTYGRFPASLGTGCLTANGGMSMKTALRAAANLELGVSLQGGPAAAAAVLMLGLRDPAWVFPGGVCAVIHVDPVAFLSLAATDAQGNLPLTFIATTPWNSALAGVDLFTQVLALDPAQPGLPVAFSQGQRCPTPLGNATGTAPINCKRTYSTSSATAATGSTPSTSSVPTLFGY